MKILDRKTSDGISIRVAEEKVVRERFMSRPTISGQRDNLRKDVTDFTKKVKKLLSNYKAQTKRQEKDKKDDSNHFSLLGISLHTKEFDELEKNESDEMKFKKN